MVVSSSHGDLAQKLPVSHLECSGIETREQQPPFSTSLGALSLEPFDVISSIPRTQIPFSTTAGGLSGPAGTPIVIPTSVGLQGLGRSPITTIITPAVNVGGSTSTIVTRTGSLSDPGVIHPEFVSREVLDGTLKAVHSLMREELDALKRLMKGKGPATEPEPLPSTP
ncbi:hypothetical protein L6452_05118 [Arctium lappa]|uniref:Uncharacterized protein n=1 Tax=Arctium lappa TaxID=4217 RepID=A0ACB9EFH8_ARCLA|nr:hypothetical protein L6452_05118 [Arctium lappa]